MNITKTHFHFNYIMYQKFILTFMMFAACPGVGWAQTSTTKVITYETVKPAEDLPRMRWDVGTDLLWLIDKNTLAATSVFVRYNVTPEKHIPGAVRFRVGMDFNTFHTEFYNKVDPEDRKTISPLVRIGYEWQHQQGRCQFFYGADVHLMYSVTHFELIDSDTDAGESILFRHKDMAWEAGPVGFVGFKYFLSPHISFSTEVSYSVIYRYRKFEDTSRLLNDPEGSGGIGTIDDRIVNGKFSPLSVINFSYHF